MVDLKNAIEKNMQPVANDLIDLIIANAEINAELEKTRLEVLKAFMSENELKTELTPSERKLISMGYQLADNPYPEVLARITDKNKRIKVMKLLAIPVLKKYFDNYLYYGGAVDRKGRKEDLKAIASTLNPMGSGVDIEDKSRWRDKL